MLYTMRNLLHEMSKANLLKSKLDNSWGSMQCMCGFKGSGKWIFASTGFHHVTWQSSAINFACWKALTYRNNPKCYFRQNYSRLMSSSVISKFTFQIQRWDLYHPTTWGSYCQTTRSQGNKKHLFLWSIRPRIPKVFKWRWYASVTSKNLITYWKKSLEESTHSNDKQTMGFWWSFCITWIKPARIRPLDKVKRKNSLVHAQPPAAAWLPLGHSYMRHWMQVRSWLDLLSNKIRKQIMQLMKGIIKVLGKSLGKPRGASWHVSCVMI